ncbi:hypothetical protein BU17DRAFT_82193 [Hysterangium stoloniferum]|nr:hypothetical protein BU17DRAFT_82193 [Hysterangium stoloniferum]
MSFPVAGLLIGLWLIGASDHIVVSYLFARSAIILKNPIQDGCFPIIYPNFILFSVAGALSGAIQATYLGLALYAVLRRKQSLNLSNTPMLKVFFRDGTAYFFCILGLPLPLFGNTLGADISPKALYVFNLLLIRFGRTLPLQIAGSLWIISVVSVFASRMMLNLRMMNDPSDDSTLRETCGSDDDRCEFSTIPPAGLVSIHRTV